MRPLPETAPGRRFLTALPVFNEARHVEGVLDEVLRFTPDVLVVDDGSTDGTSRLLADRLERQGDIRVVRHAENRGYGAALITAFSEATSGGWDGLVTIDCDGQHQPVRIPRFVAACRNSDIVSGSRYLKQYEGDSTPPAQRMFINKQITRQINDRFGLSLTDAFCGFKAYRTSALKLLDIQDDGYAMPLELWTQAAMLNFRILEIPVPLLYLDLNRSFGGSLDQAEVRLAYYNKVLDDSTAKMIERGFAIPRHDTPPNKVCSGDCS
jgi:dolichol-phosphate mannosyltransferase